MVVYHLEDSVPKFLIQKRKLHWKGYEFPKGGVEKFESKRKTIRREMKEEVGLKIVKIKNHNKKGKYLYTKELKDRPGIIGQTYSLYSVQVEKGIPKHDKKEHYSSEWLSYREAMKKLSWENQKECLKMVHKYIKA